MRIFLIFILSSLFFSTSTFAESRGEMMYKKLTCFACHGEAGRGMVRKKDKFNKKTGKYKYRKGDMLPGFERYPKLAGQSSVYLLEQMKDFFSGKRTNGLSSAMMGVKGLVDSTAKPGDLKAISDYLSKVK